MSDDTDKPANEIYVQEMANTECFTLPSPYQRYEKGLARLAQNQARHLESQSPSCPSVQVDQWQHITTDYNALKMDFLIDHQHMRGQIPQENFLAGPDQDSNRFLHHEWQRQIATERMNIRIQNNKPERPSPSAQSPAHEVEPVDELKPTNDDLSMSARLQESQALNLDPMLTQEIDISATPSNPMRFFEKDNDREM